MQSGTEGSLREFTGSWQSSANPEKRPHLTEQDSTETDPSRISPRSSLKLPEKGISCIFPEFFRC